MGLLWTVGPRTRRFVVRVEFDPITATRFDAATVWDQ